MEVWVIINKWVKRGEYHAGVYLYSSEEEAQREFNRMVENYKTFYETRITAHDYEIDDDLDYLFSVRDSKGKDVYYEEFFLTDRILE